MGAFNEAIKILEEVLKWSKENKTFTFDFARGFEGAIQCLKNENKGFIYGTNKDTEYKIELTKWIEANIKLKILTAFLKSGRRFAQ